MDEYISKEALLAEIAADYGNWTVCKDTDESYRQGVRDNYDDTIRLINDIPAADVQPVKHGRWERRMAKIYACSECTNEVTDRQRQNYSFCPYCGALMDVAYKDDKIRAIKVVGWDGGGE